MLVASFVIFGGDGGAKVWVSDRQHRKAPNKVIAAVVGCGWDGCAVSDRYVALVVSPVLILKSGGGASVETFTKWDGKALNNSWLTEVARGWGVF